MALRFSSIITLLAIFLCNSCSTPETQKPLLERNTEARAYFDVLEELVDEYYTLVETMLISAKEMKEKEASGEEPSFFDGIKILGSMGESLLKITELANEIEKTELQHLRFEQNLSREDFAEFMGIYEKMLQRFYDISKKAEELVE